MNTERNTSNEWWKLQAPLESLRVMAGIVIIIVTGLSFNSLSPYIRVGGTAIFTLIVIGASVIFCKKSLSLSLLDIAILVFLCFQLVSIGWAPFARPAAEQLLNNLLLVIFFLLIRQMLQGSWTISNWIDSLILFGVAMVLMEVVLFTTWLISWSKISQNLFPPIGYRSSGLIFGHPNVFAGYLDLLLPIQLAKIVETRGLGRRLGHAFLFGLLGFGLFLTSSRGGWLAGILGIVVTLSVLLAGNDRLRKLFSPRDSHGRINRLKVIWFSLFFLLILVIGFAASWQIARTGHASPVQSRLPVWQGSFEVIKDSPIIGAGLRGFPSRFAAASLEHHEEDIPHAHNIFLQVWAEFGIIGLGILVTIILITIIGCLNKFKAATIERRAEFAPYLGILAAVLGHQLIDYTLDVSIYLSALFVIVAIMNHKGLLALGSFSLQIKGSLLIPITVVALIGMVSFQDDNWRHWQGVQFAEAGDWDGAALSLCQNAAGHPTEPVAQTSCLLAMEFATDKSPFQSSYQPISANVVDPNWFVHWQNRAMELAMEGDSERAVTTLAQAVELAPEKTDLWLGLARMSEVAGRHELANQAFQRAFELDPSSLDSNLVLNSELAGPIARQYRLRYADQPPDRYWLPSQQIVNGEYQSALDMLNSLPSSTKTGQTYFNLLVQTYIGLGNLDMAEQYLAIADFIRPPSVETLWLKSQIERLRGNRELADKLFMEVVDHTLKTTQSRRYYFAAFGRASLPVDHLPATLRGSITPEMVHYAIQLAQENGAPEIKRKLSWFVMSAGASSLSN